MWVYDEHLFLDFPGSFHEQGKPSFVFTFKMNWLDCSTEFKCDRRRSTSFTDTAEMASSTYGFQNKGLIGDEAKPLCSIPSITKIGNDGGY